MNPNAQIAPKSRRPLPASSAPQRKRRPAPRRPERPERPERPGQTARPEARRAPAPKPVVMPAPEPKPAAFVCRPAELEFDSIASTSMFNTLGKVRALPAVEASQAIVCASIAETRGYQAEDLQALAEVGYHYIRNGGYKLAAVIFEGLTTIVPGEVYYALALGLTKDYLGDKAEARHHYERALKLDPKDPRPEINLAELELEAGNKKRALARLQRGLQKAKRAQDQALQGKAEAMIELLKRS